jgi:D-3-phosphoglycerate dehydrogenase
MKPDVYLINTSKDGVVDEKALYNALKARKLKGAALDAFEKEPVPRESPLLTSDNITVTPHIFTGKASKFCKNWSGLRSKGKVNVSFMG